MAVHAVMSKHTGKYAVRHTGSRARQGASRMDDGRRKDTQSAAIWERTPGQTAYRVSRENMTALLKEYPDIADRIVPACPEWTVRDLLAHVLDGCRHRYRTLGRQSESLPPTEDLGIGELLDEWAWLGPQVELLLGDRRGFGYDVLVMDVFTHELDLRRVVDLPPNADHPALPTAVGLLLGGFSASVYAHGLPALRVETEGAAWDVGWGKPAVTVRAHRLDLYRSIAGRRTHRQIAELDWSAPAEPWLPAFTWGPFDPPAQPTEDVIGIDALT